MVTTSILGLTLLLDSGAVRLICLYHRGEIDADESVGRATQYLGQGMSLKKDARGAYESCGKDCTDSQGKYRWKTDP